MAKRQHAMATIAEQGLTPVTKSPVVQTATVENLIPSLELQGQQLANDVILACQNQARGWTPFYQRLLKLGKDARVAFRKALTHAMGRRTDEQGNVIEPDAIEKGARQSARVRLSEFNTICRALEAGIAMEEDWAFHYAVAHARTALRASAAGGDNRGRKAASPADKLVAYLIKHAPEVGGWKKVEKLVAKAEEQAQSEAE